MKETTVIESYHFNTKYKIHGYLAHDWAPQGMIRWYIYVMWEGVLW